MNTLVAYDSQFGNTEKIAQQIASTLGEFGSAHAARITELGAHALDGMDLLVVGGPTQAWSATPAVKIFLGRLDPPKIERLFFAGFDTRLNKPGWLTGSAARGIDKQLRRLFARVLMAPASFLVKETEGPLVEGELERAAKWAHDLHDAYETQMESLVVPI